MMMMDWDKQHISELAHTTQVAKIALPQTDVNMMASDKTKLARGELIQELKSVLREVDLDPRILEKAVLQAPPESVEVWSAEYQRRLVEGDAPYLQEQVRAAYTCLTKGKAAASSTWLGDARSMRAYYLLELWVHRRGVCAYTATFERMRDVLRETYKTAHAVSRIGVYFEYKSFEDARAYVRTLGLKSKKEWQAWKKSGARPHDIPSNPHTTYKESGWTSYGDFLGYAVGKVAGEFLTFEDARTYVHTLGLKSWKEWQAWKKSGARPPDIPSNPVVTYKESGWTSLGDFLGFAEGKVAGSYRTFEDARAYVRTLGLMGVKEWNAWSSSNARPYDIPSSPNVTYRSSGWLSFGDFLGYAVDKQARKTKESKFRSFDDARAYVRTFNLKNKEEWKEWSKSGARPRDIPSAPDVTYKDSGWTSLGDFLGYADGKVAGSCRSFEDARAHVRKLGLKSQKDWFEWTSSGARPHDIPANPDKTYKSSGWTSLGDFLGYADGKVTGSFRTFEDARAYVHTLGLKSQKAWREWNSSGKRPHDIPCNPDVTYASSGWTSFGDFLGYDVGKVANTLKRKARA